MQRFFGLLFLCLFLALPFSAQAETSIAVVDVQALLSRSDAALSIDKQADELKNKFMVDVSKQEQALRENEAKLTSERASLSKEEFAERAKEFEGKLIEMRRAAQIEKRKYDEATTKALNQLRDKLYEIVQQIAKEKKYSLVISKQNVIVGEQSIDITEESLKRLNAALPSISLVIADQ
jgi:outer membrane protein